MNIARSRERLHNGGDNMKNWKRLVCLALAMLIFSGCGAAAAETEAPSVPTETAASAILADGEPGTVFARGSYTGTGSGAQEVAMVGAEHLTNGMLQIYYRMAIRNFQAAGITPAPDFSRPLDAQLRTGEEADGSWQQYFLAQALENWHLQRAMEIQSKKYVKREEKNFAVNKELHAEYMDECMAVSPAKRFLYTDDATFAPNTMHEAWLNAIPDMLETLAEELGFGDTEALAKGAFGSMTGAEDLIAYTHMLNWDYAWFTEKLYDINPTEEEIRAFLEAHPTEAPQQGYTVNLRHILLIPEDAEVAEDGRVTASEKAWKTCSQKADSLFLKARNQIYPEPGFATLAHDNSVDAGSSLAGGMYENVLPGQLMEPLDAWAFDPARMPGDRGRFDSEYGCHLTYFSGRTDLDFLRAREELVRQLAMETVAELPQTYPMKVDYENILLEETAPVPELTVDRLLYPDVAHERFPEVPIFIQQDYDRAPFGPGWYVGHHGCGITSYAMLATYMTDSLQTPGAMAEKYARYSVRDGSDYTLFYYPPAEMGFFLEGFGGNLDQVLGALKEGKPVVNVQTKGYFTRAGHFMVLSGVDEDGLVTIRDSNLYNYKRLEEHKVDKFDPKLLLPSALMFWIYDKKVTSIPVCTRCGDREGTCVQDYLCPKCRQALLRRDSFLSLMGA